VDVGLRTVEAVAVEPVAEEAEEAEEK